MKQIIEAAQALLDKLSNLTTQEFGLAGEKAERERLRLLLASYNLEPSESFVQSEEVELDGKRGTVMTTRIVSNADETLRFGIDPYQRALIMFEDLRHLEGNTEYLRGIGVKSVGVGTKRQRREKLIRVAEWSYVVFYDDETYHISRSGLHPHWQVTSGHDHTRLFQMVFLSPEAAFEELVKMRVLTRGEDPFVEDGDIVVTIEVPVSADARIAIGSTKDNVRQATPDELDLWLSLSIADMLAVQVREYEEEADENEDD